MELINPTRNSDDTAGFLLKKPTDYLLPNFVVPAGYRLLTSKAKHSTEGTIRSICLIAETGNTPETVYKVTTIVRAGPNEYMSKKNGTQLLVWRTTNARHSLVLRDFPSKVFNHLLDQYDIMITDNQQTNDGKRFWEYRMAEAVEDKNKNVYFIDLNTLNSDMIPIIESIKTYEELVTNYILKSWGKREDFRNQVFVISTENISQ